MTEVVRIAVDAMGGDHGPEATVPGILEARARYGGEYLLLGDPTRIYRAAGGSLPDGFAVEEAPEEIGMDEHPLQAVRSKRRSPIVMGVAAVADGRASAFVSAGHTGAVMAASTLGWGRLQGVERPAIATLIPTTKDPCVLVDAGATVDSRPEHLVGFAVLGSVFHAFLYPREKPPRVGLLSNGQENEKGNLLTREALPLLRRAPIRFDGYAEGRDIPSGEWDVVVCDGFVGNALLKFGEGLARLFHQTLKAEIASLGVRGKAGAAMLLPAFDAMKRRFDYAEYGGAPLLGLNHLSIICHGASPAKALREAARVALDAARMGVVEKMKSALA